MNVSVSVEFNEKRLLVLTRKGSIAALRRAGAYLRGAAQRAVVISSQPALPGKPAHSRQGRLKRSILFAVERQRMAVLVGPAFSIMGRSMTAHEYGGTFRGREYPKRPLMGPTLRSTTPQLAAFWRDTVK